MMTFFIAIHMSLILSFPLSLMRSPSKRRWYSTVAGLTVGFYTHGLTNLVHIFQVASIYPFIKYLPRHKAMRYGVIFAFFVMMTRNIYPYWDGYLSGFPRTQATTNFMRFHIFLCNFYDAGILDDP